MPVQIYLWSDSPERAFTERTSAAIMVLLGFSGDDESIRNCATQKNLNVAGNKL